MEIEDDDARMLKPLFMEVVDNASLGCRNLSVLNRSMARSWQTIRLVFDELARSRPDYQVVMNFARVNGLH